MPPVTTYAISVTTGHGCWPPTKVARPSQKSTFVALDPVVLFGDVTIPHTCIYPCKGPCCTHSGLCAGFVNVLVELRPVQTIGSKIVCGFPIACGIDRQAVGNPQVIIGGFGNISDLI
jgi:hypothetical protein